MVDDVRDHGLCNESSELHPSLTTDSWLWPSWTIIRHEIVHWLGETPDFFRQLGTRRHFKWLFAWFSEGSPRVIWRSTCPIGVLALRIFTVLLSNDADRCIQFRDAGMATEIMGMPFEAVVQSGWPLFNMLNRLSDETRRVSFPLGSSCDNLDGPEGSIFQTSVRQALDQGEKNPVSAAVAYLRSTHVGCPFGQATASLVVARAKKKDQCFSPQGCEADIAHLVAGAHERLLGWPPLHRNVYDLITTRWPVWDLLDRLTSLPTYRRLPTPTVNNFQVDIVFCGMGWMGMRRTLRNYCQQHAWRLHHFQADPSFCPDFYRDVASQIQNHSVVVVLSPLLWDWPDESGDALRSVIGLLPEQDGLQVLGLPTVSKSSHWNFNVLRLTFKDWTLDYAPYPTGYQKTLGDRCFQTDATSGTRVYRNASLWFDLLRATDLNHISVKCPFTQMAIFDLTMLKLRLNLHTCFALPLREDPYFDSALLGTDFATRHLIEFLQFPSRPVQIRCLTASELQDAGDARGVPLPRCLEADAKSALDFVLDKLPGGPPQLIETRGSATLLATHGATVLDRTQEPNQTAIIFITSRPPDCGTNYRQQSCDEFNTNLKGLPPNLRAVFDPGGLKLRFFSSRLQIPVLEIWSGTSISQGHRSFHITRRGATINFAVATNIPRKTSQRPAPRYRNVDVVLCARNEVIERSVRRFAVEVGFRIHTRIAEARECPRFLREVAGDLSDESMVIFLSPFLLTWHEGSEFAVLEGLELLREQKIHLLGFSAEDGEGNWRWNIRNIRHQYWKLLYNLPRGSEHVKPVWEGVTCGICLPTKASGASKVFQSSMLFKDITSRLETDLIDDTDWTVDLDLVIRSFGVELVVCSGISLPETDYLDWTTLTPYLSQKYQIEVAQFLASRFERCLAGANWFQVTDKGLVAPWCFRRDVTRSFRAVSQWWTSVDSANNFIVPEEGTFLALFRNGAAGMLPWDSDFDAKLYSQARFIAEEFMNLTRAPAFQETELEAYLYRGCGQDSYVLLRRPNITHHIGDVYIRGEQSLKDHPWRADLFGSTVRVGPGHMEHIFFNRYRTPVRKLFGDGLPLHCLSPGHNACLPECRDPEIPCEFEDNFVHWDVF